MMTKLLNITSSYPLKLFQSQSLSLSLSLWPNFFHQMFHLQVFSLPGLLVPLPYVPRHCHCHCFAGFSLEAATKSLMKVFFLCHEKSFDDVFLPLKLGGWSFARKKVAVLETQVVEPLRPWWWSSGWQCWLWSKGPGFNGAPSPCRWQHWSRI